MAIEMRPTRQFWCPSMVVPSQIRDAAVDRIKRGDAVVEFHAHLQGTSCEGFSEPVLARADEESDWHRLYPHDRCWRHPA